MLFCGEISAQPPPFGQMLGSRGGGRGVSVVELWAVALFRSAYSRSTIRRISALPVMTRSIKRIPFR